MSPTVTLDVHLDARAWEEARLTDVRSGLGATPKRLSPVWFYDERGSELFDEITRLPEYYLTRAEQAILSARAGAVAERSGATSLVELGSGTSTKTRLLLEALGATGQLERFVALDVSEETLCHAAAAIAGDYGIEVHAVVGDFHHHLGDLPRAGRRLVAFLGSTIGNFTPAERQKLFMDLDAAMDHGDAFLLGTDLVKDPQRLLAAYDDSQGVTAEFNRNALCVLNRELGGDLVPDAFEHVARWNADERWIEMWLRSTRDQQAEFACLGLDVSFAAGEEVHTEISAKFTLDQVRAELGQGGFVVDETWTDPAGDFALTLAHPYC